MVNNQDAPDARGKVVSARVNRQLYDEVKASGISTADLLKVALGKVKPDLTPSNIAESIEPDPEILAKEKELRLARLDRELAEVRAPLDVTSRMDALEDYLMGLEEHLNEIDSRLAAMKKVSELVKRPDPRLARLEQHAQWVTGVLWNAIPPRLDDMDARMASLAKWVKTH